MNKIAVITLMVFIFFANSIIFAQTDDINVKITPSYKDCPTGRINITMTGGFEPYT